MEDVKQILEDVEQILEDASYGDGILTYCLLEEHPTINRLTASGYLTVDQFAPNGIWQYTITPNGEELLKSLKNTDKEED